MFGRVKEILKDYVEVSDDKIIPGANLMGDLGLNSLDVVNIVMEFEDVFGLVIPDEDIGKFVTVQDIVEYVEEAC